MLLDERSLKEKIKSSPTGAYLICGDEDYLKKVYVDRIVSASVEADFADFNFHKYDGKECVLGDVYDSVEAFPMMSSTSCVLVTDMALNSLEGNEADMLSDMVRDVPDTCALIFYMKSVATSSAGWKSVKQLFEEYGSLVVLDKKTTSDVIKTLESAAKKNGVPFEKYAASYLIECVGNDLNTLHNELQKLCAYASGRTIAKADIDAVCAKSLEAKAFDIMRALHSGNFDLAMNKLAVVLAQREEPIKLLGAFITSYLDIYRAKAAIVSGYQASEAAKYFDYKKKEFRLNNAVRDGKGLSLPAIYRCLDILAQADDMLKSYETDKNLVLEQTLAKLAVAEGESRR